MVQQLLLPLDHPKRYEDELIYGVANADVCDWLEHYENWPIKHVMVIGPEKSGKTTLALLAQKKYGISLLSGERIQKAPLIISRLPSNDIFLDEAEQAPQEWLFHLYNHQILSHRKLILFSKKPWQEWRCTIKDLESRLKTFYPLPIHEMDDLLAQQLACKLLSSRGIAYDMHAVSYLCLRLERSYKALVEAIDHLDTILLGHHKRLTLPQVREYVLGLCL